MAESLTPSQLSEMKLTYRKLLLGNTQSTRFQSGGPFAYSRHATNRESSHPDRVAEQWPEGQLSKNSINKGGRNECFTTKTNRWAGLGLRPFGRRGVGAGALATPWIEGPTAPIDQTRASRPESSPPSQFCEHQPAIRVASLLPSAFPASGH